MVSSVRVGQSLIDAAAVLATLTAPENLPDPAQQLARLPALPLLEVSGALRRGDEVACTDFLKAACGLMLGIGLTTGPLYPDLMALFRNFLPRRTPLANSPRRSGARRKARSAASGAGSGSAEHCSRAIRTQIRRRGFCQAKLVEWLVSRKHGAGGRLR